MKMERTVRALGLGLGISYLLSSCAEVPATTTVQETNSPPQQAAVSTSSGGGPHYDGPPSQAPEMVGMYIMGFKFGLAAFCTKACPHRDAYFEIASQIANKIGVAPPPLPRPSGDAKQDANGARMYLYRDLDPLVRSRLQGKSYATEAEAIFELALRAAEAVTQYSPAKDNASFIGKVPELGDAAKVPPLIWKPAVELAEQKRSVPEVRQAFFVMERLLLDYYGFADAVAKDDGDRPSVNEDVFSGPENSRVFFGLSFVLGLKMAQAAVMNVNRDPKIRAGAPDELAVATQCAQQFGGSIGPPPPYSGNLATDMVKVIQYLHVQQLPLLEKAIDAKDPTHVGSALVEFGSLLPVAEAFYDPRDSKDELAETMVQSLEEAGQKAGLPARIWGDAVKQLERRSSVKVVSNSLHRVQPETLNYFGFGANGAVR